MLNEPQGQLAVDAVEDIIVARIIGTPTLELLALCQTRVLELIRETGSSWILYDAMKMVAPSVDVAWSQRSLDASASVQTKRAIVVPNARIAYLARLAFADEFGVSKVVYEDYASALAWLRAAG